MMGNFAETPWFRSVGMERRAERWRRVRFTEFERRQIAAVRQELDAEYETAITTQHVSQQARTVTGIPSTPRT